MENVIKDLFSENQIHQIENIVEEKLVESLPVIDLIENLDLTKSEIQMFDEAYNDFKNGKSESFEKVFKKCMK